MDAIVQSPVRFPRYIIEPILVMNFAMASAASTPTQLRVEEGQISLA